MSVKSKLVTIGDTANAVVVLDDGTVLVADHNHARFDEISQRSVVSNQQQYIPHCALHHALCVLLSSRGAAVGGETCTNRISARQRVFAGKS